MTWRYACQVEVGHWQQPGRWVARLRYSRLNLVPQSPDRESPHTTPLIESNRVRAIAVSGLKRSPAFPNVPAVAETPGLANFETDLWYGMLAPAGTPPRIVDKLYRETKRVLFLPEFKSRFEPTGTVMVGSSPAEFAQTIMKDLAKWAMVIQSSGAKLD